MNGGTAPSQGPMYGMSSVIATQLANRSAYLSPPGTRPIVPSSHRPKPAVIAMTSETRTCPLT